jgi:hypothetical protein
MGRANKKKEKEIKIENTRTQATHARYLCQQASRAVEWPLGLGTAWLASGWRPPHPDQWSANVFTLNQPAARVVLLLPLFLSAEAFPGISLSPSRHHKPAHSASSSLIPRRSKGAPMATSVAPSRPCSLLGRRPLPSQCPARGLPNRRPSSLNCPWRHKSPAGFPCVFLPALLQASLAHLASSRDLSLSPWRASPELPHTRSLPQARELPPASANRQV